MGTSTPSSVFSTAAGGVTVAFANWGTTTENVSFSLSGTKSHVYAGTRHEYVLTSTELTSRFLFLNGAATYLTSAQQLLPRIVQEQQQPPAMTIPGHSFGFIVAVNASVPVCL